MLILLVVGALVLGWFFWSVRAKERAGQEPLLSTALFRNRTSNLGLVTQNTQWLLLLGVICGRGLPPGGAWLRRHPDRRDLHRGHRRAAGVVSGRRAPGQVAGAADPHPGRLHHHHRRHRGPAHPGQRVPQRLGVCARTAPHRTGGRHHADPSVNVVQSSFPDALQGEISGLSRSVSNLCSCLGTAIGGTILVAGITSTPGRAYGLALATLAAIGLIGLVASALLPADLTPATPPPAPETPPGHSGQPRPLTSG